MSDQTRCNYCSLEAMERTAAARGATVVLAADDGWFTARYSDRAEPSAWFLALTDECSCYGTRGTVRVVGSGNHPGHDF